MFVVAKLDTYSYEDGERLESIYGPFTTREEAAAFEARVDTLKLVGIEFRVKEVEATERLIEFLNGIGFGAV